MLAMSPDFSVLKAISRVRKDENIDNDVDFQLLPHRCIIVSKNPSADSGIQSVRAFLELLQFSSFMTITMVKLVCQKCMSILLVMITIMTTRVISMIFRYCCISPGQNRVERRA